MSDLPCARHTTQSEPAAVMALGRRRRRHRLSFPTSKQAWVFVCLLASCAFKSVAAFWNRAGSCDGVGGFHFDTYGNRTIVQGLTLADHGMEFTVNGIALTDYVEQPDSGGSSSTDSLVTVVRFTPETNYTAELIVTIATDSTEMGNSTVDAGVASADGWPTFRGALIRVEALSSDSDNNDAWNTSLSPLFQLEAWSDNAQVSDLCFGNVQAVSHVDNQPKTELVAAIRLLDDVVPNGTVTTDTTLWTIDVTVVEVNNATTSMFSYSRYRIQSQIVVAELPSSVTTPMPMVSLFGNQTMPPASPPSLSTTSWAPSSDPFSAGNESMTTFVPTSNSAGPSPAAVAAANSSLPPTPSPLFSTTTTSTATPTAADVILYTFEPTATPAPSTTQFPTFTDVCRLCEVSSTEVATSSTNSSNSSSTVRVDETLFMLQPDAVVIFFNSLITCRELARDAPRLTDTACVEAVQAARTGCQCRGATADSGSTSGSDPSFNNATDGIVPPSSPAQSASNATGNGTTDEASVGGIDDISSCVLCPITLPTAFIVRDTEWGTVEEENGENAIVVAGFNYSLPCRDVEQAPDRLVPILWNELQQSCSKVQQVVAQSCGCSLVEAESDDEVDGNDPQSPPSTSGSSLSSLWESSGSLGVMLTTTGLPVLLHVIACLYT